MASWNLHVYTCSCCGSMVHEGFIRIKLKYRFVFQLNIISFDENESCLLQKTTAYGMRFIEILLHLRRLVSQDSYHSWHTCTKPDYIMRGLIQRVNHASVTIAKQETAAIGHGLLIFLGIEMDDSQEDIHWLANKISRLRIFTDAQGQMNWSVNDVNGEVMVISQFTLHAKTKKGTRPSYSKAAKPHMAIPLYHQFIKQMQQETGREIKSGEFGAYMKINLENDGPVTLLIDSRNKDL